MNRSITSPARLNRFWRCVRFRLGHHFSTDNVPTTNDTRPARTIQQCANNLLVFIINHAQLSTISLLYNVLWHFYGSNMLVTCGDLYPLNGCNQRYVTGVVAHFLFCIRVLLHPLHRSSSTHYIDEICLGIVVIIVIQYFAVNLM